MSYNPSYWHQTYIENLVIPVGSFYIHKRRDWHPERTGENAQARYEVAESYIEGRVEGDHLHVKTFDCIGDGAGTAFNWIWLPALRLSTGRYGAAVVWEGEAVQLLSVINGRVDTREVDLQKLWEESF